MRTSLTVLALGCSILAIGCYEPPGEPRSPDIQETIDNLISAGFPADDITLTAGKVYVGGDAEVSLAASREMLQTGDDTEEQYRTSNLVGTFVTRICINGDTFTGVLGAALDLAIQNYNELGLGFAMVRTPATGCSATIHAVIIPGGTGGSAGFPAGGLPFGVINIGDSINPFNVDMLEHLITHELGHTIGLRHSDFFNRGISCGGSGNEGGGTEGAILIPGTDPGAAVGGSVMNSCFRPTETGEFTAGDIAALRAVYAPTCTFSSCDTLCSRTGFCESSCISFGLCACRQRRPCP